MTTSGEAKKKNRIVLLQTIYLILILTARIVKAIKQVPFSAFGIIDVTTCRTLPL